MKRRHFLSLAACGLLGLLPGCSFPMTDNMQVEDLLRAPRLSGDYGALQSALNDWLGESAQLKYPMQGELLSPFLLQDLDGDGEQDAAVLYTTAQSSNVCIAFLQKDAAGAWKVQQTIEGLADTVDNVRLAQLQDGNAVQLVVGYLAAQGDSYLAVYSYEHGEVNAILEQSYEQYLVEDITGGGNEDLILMSTLEDGGVQIELLTVNRDGSFQQVAVMGLSADKFSGCASVASGLGADGRHYLVLDGWTGISGNNLATVLLRFDEESQQMIPAEQISASALYSASLRNVPNLVSRDLDGDGTEEEYFFGTLHQNIPAGYQHTLSDSFGIAAGDMSERAVFPCVWKTDADGSIVPVPEFAEKLIQPQVKLQRTEGNESPAPAICEADNSVWHGGVQVLFSIENLGSWYYSASATLDGQTLTAATMSHVFDISKQFQ
mgnify:CR=1 FL=1